MDLIVPVEDRAHLAAETFATLTPILAEQRSIARALAWMRAQRPPLAPADLVTQDEYSHDVLVPYPNGLWLVYDST